MSGGNPFGGLVGALCGTYVLRIMNGLKKSFILADILGIIGTIIIVL